jgi:two-component sensor histidine kinase
MLGLALRFPWSAALPGILSSDGFMPHGMCYLWRPGILGLHVVSDTLITLAYFSIPFTLLYFARKRADLKFTWIFVSFAIFIVACGTTHLLEIWTIWFPDYWVSGAVKAVTALASVPTAILLAKLVPVALRLPSPSTLEAANIELAREVADRTRAEDEIRQINSSLETRVTERTVELEALVLLRTAELKEREALLQEIHHRVKNNLQVISSLINMQVRSLSDASSRAALRQCQSRVETMAQIHEMLYRAKDYARIPFSKYAQDLASRVLSASGISPASIALDFSADELWLAVDRAIPCGLMLNELVANALKHAFKERASGTISVALRKRDDSQVVMTVSDDGVGIQQDFDPVQSTSMGIQLIMTLVKQLDGSLEIIRQMGTAFRITFPAEIES